MAIMQDRSPLRPLALSAAVLFSGLLAVAGPIGAGVREEALAGPLKDVQKVVFATRLRGGRGP